MTQCLVGMGSNLGDSQANLLRALELLRATPGIDEVVVSRFRLTAPVGGPVGQPDFLNGAVKFSTSLSPHALLAVLQGIEAKLGRTREVHWGPRTVDLDLLLYDDAVIDSPELTVPHPRLAERAFVLAPAIEIAATMRHPTRGLTIGELLEQLPAQQL